jgi:NhaP-type Na+/H+ and K+/H+ antiporter
VNDDPFDTRRVFGIYSDDDVIPYDTTGTVVHFESRVPTKQEKTHLPIILLTGEDWNPTQEILRPVKQNRETMEMRAIHLTTRQRVNAVAIDEAQVEPHGETKIQLSQILCVYNPRDFSKRLVASVNIATAYHADIDKWSEEKRKVSSIITNDRHLAATPEDLA